jgi:hypothetical protein
MTCRLCRLHQHKIINDYMAISSCTVCVWECLQSPVGRGSGLACVCPLTSMGCCRVPACYVLLVPVLFMWNVLVLLLMHLLGAADCVVASYVFVVIILLFFFGRRRRQGERLASLALWRLPSVSLVWGCAGVTIRFIGHRWACLQGCPAVGSVREPLTSQRRCCDRYQCTYLGYVPWTGRSGLRSVWSSEEI